MSPNKITSIKNTVFTILITLNLFNCREETQKMEEIQGSNTPKFKLMDLQKFKRSIQNFSTARNLVVVKIKTKDLGEKYICTEPGFLRRAIQIEHGLSFGKESFNRVDSLLLRSYLDGLEINNPSALENIGFFKYDLKYYTIKRKKAFQLLPLNFNDSILFKIAVENFKNQIYSAHFIIENNRMVKRGCIARNIFIDNKEKNEFKDITTVL